MEECLGKFPSSTGTEKTRELVNELKALTKSAQIQYNESAFAYALTNLMAKKATSSTAKDKNEKDMKNVISHHHALLLERKHGSSVADIHPVLLEAAKQHL